jgi:hypothetical protein
MAVENKRRITEACKGAGIDFLQAIIIKDQEDRQGLPVCVKLVPGASFPNLLDMADADLIADNENLPGRLAAPVEITRLSALPYYHRNEQWVDEYYRNRKARRNQ